MYTAYSQCQPTALNQRWNIIRVSTDGAINWISSACKGGEYNTLNKEIWTNIGGENFTVT